MVEGCSLRKPRPARHRSRGKPPTTAPGAPQHPVPHSPWGKATKVPQPKTVQGEPPPLGRRSRHCPPGSAPPAPLQPPGCSAGSQGLPPLRHPLRQPQAALPRLDVRPLAQVPISPLWGAPGHPWGPVGGAPSSPPGRVLHRPGLAPGAWPPCPCPGQMSPAARRRHRTAPRGTQESCDAGRYPGGDSTLPIIPAGATPTRRHPASPPHSWSPSLGGGTHPTPPGSCKTCL